MSLRKYSKIPLYIVDDHNEALEFILKGIGSKYLSFNKNLLIHFDSHPDLLLNLDLQSSDLTSKDLLLEKTSIETWILPAAANGHITSIVWVKPFWANQIESGHYTFHIGIHKESRKICVTSSLLYFISALIYSPMEELENTHLLNLYVVPFESLNSDNSKHLLTNLVEQHAGFLLDIDLDVFSTANPFLDMHDEINLYNRLRSIYEFVSKDELPSQAIARRTEQLMSLENVFKKLSEFNYSKDNEEDINNILKCLNSEDKKNNLKKIIFDLMENHGNNINWLLIHDAGTTIDDPNHVLPHHISTTEEIDLYCNIFNDFLICMKYPAIITMARSSSDGYCPSDQVDSIQEKVLKILRKFIEVEVFTYYSDHEG